MIDVCFWISSSISRARAPILLLLYFCAKTETHPGWRRAMANTSPCEEQRKFRPFIFAVFLPLLTSSSSNTFRFENVKPSYLPVVSFAWPKASKTPKRPVFVTITFTVVFRFSFSSRSPPLYHFLGYFPPLLRSSWISLRPSRQRWL